jgi:hypothetical protein
VRLGVTTARELVMLRGASGTHELETMGAVDTLPVFPGRTEFIKITPAGGPESKSASFADGSTKTWTTAASPGIYRAVYSNISDDEMRQLRIFRAEHGLPSFWSCSIGHLKLKNCYFPDGLRIEFKHSATDVTRWNANVPFAARYVARPARPSRPA